MTQFINFTKESCGPCNLVKKYFRSINDERVNIIQEVDLDDFSGDPIPQENLDLAKKYGVTATPVLVIADDEGNFIEKYTGGLEITQNIRRLFNQYNV